MTNAEHTIDIYTDSRPSCTRCGATDLEAATEPECCGEDRWGIWCSHPKSPGWCVRDNRGDWSGTRFEAEAEAATWGTIMANEANYSVRRYPAPAPQTGRCCIEGCHRNGVDRCSLAGGLVCDPCWAKAGYVPAPAAAAEVRAARMNDVVDALRYALADANTFGRAEPQRASVDAPSLARALFATDERVRKMALDRGEYTAGESTHAGAVAADARYRTVIARAWTRGGEGKAPEKEWRADAEVRADAVVSELGRKA